ncbi:DUF7882 family protein [Rathayibacter sp. CAU 1779]
MGLLTHGPVRIEVDDRVLVHLELVIVDKFRHGESFPLTWLDHDGGETRSTLWLSHRRPLYFHYSGDVRQLPVDRGWLRRLHDAATSGKGLGVVDADGRPAVVKVR